MSLIRALIPRRLGARLTFFLFVLLAGLAVAVGIVVFSGFRRSEDSTTRLSQEGILDFGTDTVASLATLVAEGSLAQVTPFEQTSQSAASYIVAARGASLGGAFPEVAMTREDGKGWFNPDPDREADVWLPATTAMDATVTAEIRASAVLDLFLPGELEAHPSAVAAYFVSVSGLTRYYPPVGLESRLAPNFDSQSQTFEGLAGPDANPSRASVWSPPYDDPAGRGLLVTVSSPVYDANEFLGIVGVDVSLSRFVANIDAIRPSANGYAFALASDGSILPSGSRAAIDSAVADPSNLAIGRALAAMRARQVGAERLTIAGEEVVIGYAPLGTIGGSIGLVVPVSDISDDAGIAAVAGAIADDGQRTLLFVWLTVGTLFVGALAVAWYLSRRYIAHPIGAIVSGTRAVAAGDLSVVIPVRRADEIGDLASSFNEMTATLSVRAAQLRDETAERTRTQQELEAVFAAMSDVVTVISRDGTYLRVPAQHEDRFMVPFEQIRGHNLREFFPPPAAGNLLSAIHDAIDEHRTVNTEYQLTDTDLWYSAAVSPLDEVTAVIVARDITERVRARQLLEQRVDERTRELAAVAHDLEVILTAADRLSTTLELDPLIEVAFSQLDLIAPHEGEAIYLLDGEFMRAFHRRGADRATPPRTFRLPVAESGPLTQRVLGGELVAVDDVRDQLGGAWVDNSRALGLTNLGDYVRSVLSVPLVVSGRVIGAIAMISEEPGRFTLRHQRLAQGIAYQMAVAFENARLFVETEIHASQAASLEERQRIARDLHDSVSQALYGIALGARTARSLVGRDPKMLEQPLDYVLSLAEAGLAELRALIFELRPDALKTDGLVAALDRQVAATRARHRIEVDADLIPEPAVSIEAKEALYRVAQEAMTNAIKHARATRLGLRLWADDGALRLEVRDNGVGFDTAGEFPGHMGLKSMRERAQRLGGTVDIVSAPGQGVTITVELPIGAVAS